MRNKVLNAFLDQFKILRLVHELRPQKLSGMFPFGTILSENAAAKEREKRRRPQA